MVISCVCINIVVVIKRNCFVDEEMKRRIRRAKWKESNRCLIRVGRKRNRSTEQLLLGVGTSQNMKHAEWVIPDSINDSFELILSGVLQVMNVQGNKTKCLRLYYIYS